MGDAADDMYDQSMKQERFYDMLREACPNKPDRPCNWDRNEDGMLECLTCGNLIDE